MTTLLDELRRKPLGAQGKRNGTSKQAREWCLEHPDKICVSNLAAGLGVSKYSAKHAIRVLRKHKFLKARTNREVLYDITDDHPPGAVVPSQELSGTQDSHSRRRSYAKR